MESRIAGMIGAAALAAVGAAPVAAAAHPEAVLQASSFAELLQPIPNARVLLATIPTIAAAPGMDSRDGEMMAYYQNNHHHHHHRWLRRRVVPPFMRRHHHHHHHHQNW